MPSMEHFRAVLAPIGLNLQGAVKPSSGLTGNVFIFMSDQGRFVLKVSQNPALDWKLSKERIVYGQLRILGVPAPNVLVCDLSRFRVPFAYTLSERLPGTTLSEAYPEMPDAEKRGIYRQLGDLLGRMHVLTFYEFGDVAEREGEVVAGPAPELAEASTSGELGPFATWREMHRGIVRGRLAFLSRSEFYDLTGPITVWFDKYDCLLDYAITPRLLHMDLHRSNILVSAEQISGIVDVEEAVIGHHEYDLMRLALAHFGEGEDWLREAFFTGYQVHIALDAGYESRRPFYEMSRWLVGLKCLVVFGSDDLVEETRRVRTRIHELLAL